MSNETCRQCGFPGSDLQLIGCGCFLHAVSSSVLRGINVERYRALVLSFGRTLGHSRSPEIVFEAGNVILIDFINGTRHDLRCLENFSVHTPSDQVITERIHLGDSATRSYLSSVGCGRNINHRLESHLVLLNICISNYRDAHHFRW